MAGVFNVVIQKQKSMVALFPPVDQQLCTKKLLVECITREALLNLALFLASK